MSWCLNISCSSPLSPSCTPCPPCPAGPLILYKLHPDSKISAASSLPRVRSAVTNSPENYLLLHYDSLSENKYRSEHLCFSQLCYIMTFDMWVYCQNKEMSFIFLPAQWKPGSFYRYSTIQSVNRWLTEGSVLYYILNLRI